MATRRSSVALPWRAPLHLVSILSILGALVGFTAQPAGAYDWCSDDPVFTFQRAGLLTNQQVDVQVMVPLSVIPIPSAAMLTVTVPLDVARHEVLNTSKLLFVLQTVFVSSPAIGGATSYPLTFAALVPTAGTAFPVRLVITDVRHLKVTTVDGYAGTLVSTSIQIGQ